MSTLQARNETVMNVPPESVWGVITDIHQLPKVNPGVVSATGRMDVQGATRTCEINNNGRKGTMTEKLIELVPERRTVWTIEDDSMGMKKMMRDTRFVFNLEPVDGHKTRVVSETYYAPSGLIAKVLNALVMKRMISKAQERILSNIRRLVEN